MLYDWYGFAKEKNASATLDTRDVTKRNIIEPLATKELQSALDEKYGEGSVKVLVEALNQITK